MSSFWLYERNTAFDTKLQKWRDFIETKRSELDLIEDGLCDAILSVNQNNILSENKELGEKINKLDQCDSNGKLTNKNSLFSFYNRDRFKHIYYDFFNQKGIFICPYCGCDYLFDGSNLATSTHIDHYLPRSIYPQYAGNPYNLIPVCVNCNNPKDNSPVDLENNILGFYLSTQYPVSGLYLVNKWNNDIFTTSHPKLFEICKTQQRFEANRNQSKLQVMYEYCLDDSSYYTSDIKKVLFRRTIESENGLKTVPYGNFDKQFYQWLLDNDGLVI